MIRPTVPQSPVEGAASFGVDRLELSIVGEWDRTRLNRLLTLDWGKRKLRRVEVKVIQGGRHGPDFYPVGLLRPKEWRVDVFKGSPNGYAARLFLFQKMLASGTAESLQWTEGYLSKLGLRWQSELISRLDLRADVAYPFREFRRRINSGRCVTGRMGRNRRLEKAGTCIYFGSAGGFKLRIYDKAKERGRAGLPWTRIEFELHRDWLRRQGVDCWSDADLPSLWRILTQRFRIVDRRPDGKHYDRCPTWDGWCQIQQADDSL